MRSKNDNTRKRNCFNANMSDKNNRIYSTMETDGQVVGEEIDPETEPLLDGQVVFKGPYGLWGWLKE